ncbi:MAG: FAD:protein FMN transferase [Planctomycetaceae bacterium]
MGASATIDPADADATARSEPTLLRHDFRAMGTSVHLLGPASHPSFPRAASRVERRFAREERRFSRFREDSELTRLNRASGSPVRVSRAFAEVLGLALEAAASSDGLFDPTVHDALVAAGYDRDFDEVLAGARGTLHPAGPCGRWIEVAVDGSSVRLPEGVHLDLGGVAKGWTVDRAAEDALAAGLPWALVNAGGDLRIAGAAPVLDVGVEDPERPAQELVRLRLAEGALATSSVVKRSWGPAQHHVIDPRTGVPATTELLQASVWAPTCAEAEVLATRALLEGRGAAGSLSCVLVAHDGDVLVAMPAADPDQGAA